MLIIGSVILLSHFHKVLALSKCEIEVNPIARIPRAVLVALGIRATGFTSFSDFKGVNFESANAL